MYNLYIYIYGQSGMVGHIYKQLFCVWLRHVEEWSCDYMHGPFMIRTFLVRMIFGVRIVYVE